MSHELPILNQINIATPCPASWENMTGDELSRHCSQCDKKVFHLSNMTATEAASVVEEHGGNFCARIRVTTTGELITRPARKAKLFRTLLRKTVAAAAALPLAFFAAGCSRESLPEQMQGWLEPEQEYEVTGIVAPVPPEELQGEVEIMGDIVFSEDIDVAPIDEPRASESVSD